MASSSLCSAASLYSAAGAAHLEHKHLAGRHQSQLAGQLRHPADVAGTGPAVQRSKPVLWRAWAGSHAAAGNQAAEQEAKTGRQACRQATHTETPTRKVCR